MSSRTAIPRPAAPNGFGGIQAVVAVSLGFVMAMLDVTVVNVALVAIRADLNPSFPALVWIVDAYTLTFAALLLLGGAVADRIGAKRTYMLGLVWFVAASALCALSGAPWVLIFARLLQGMGAAMFMPSSLSLLTEAFPDPARRARMLSIWAGLVGIATGSGPFVGGLLVATIGWRSIFFLNLPIGALGLLLSRRALAPSPRKPHALDLSTHLLLVLGLGGLSATLIEGPDRGWASPMVVGAGVVAAAAFALVAIRELKAAQPAIPRALAHNVPFWRLNGLGFLINFVVFGEVFLLSLALQQSYGASAFTIGLLMLPLMGVVPVTNYASGWGIKHRGRRWTLLVGLSIGVLGLILAVFGSGAPLWFGILSIAVCNAGIGFAIPAMISGVMDHAGDMDANIGSALLNADRQVGALAGVAVMGVLLQMVPAWPMRVGVGFGLFAAILGLGLLLAWQHRDAGGAAQR
jgi:DHA2 family methylenomycin A resistance protein-like MFS transporter